MTEVFVEQPLASPGSATKLIPFVDCPKGGVKPKSKIFGVVFLGPSFGHYGGKGWRFGV